MEQQATNELGTLGYANKIWHSELMVIGNNTISLSNIIVAILLGFIGLKFSNTIYQLISKKIDKNFSHDKDNALLIKTVIFYSIYILCGIVILEVANIPLSIFAFVGGAIAIAAGLGAQNVINNFISGIIILFSRPIKIGDIIKVDGIVGKVKSIGIRCTIIQKYNNIEALVPNSVIMQKNLFNWSYEKQKIHFELVVTLYKISRKNTAFYKATLETCLNKLKNLPFVDNHSLPEVNIINIDKLEDKISIIFFLKNKDFEKINQIQHDINMCLVESFENDFSVEYKTNLS